MATVGVNCQIVNLQSIPSRLSSKHGS